MMGKKKKLPKGITEKEIRRQYSSIEPKTRRYLGITKKNFREEFIGEINEMRRDEKKKKKRK